jgi:phage shock protein PspC (stress-responsive transcriptional regulator)
MSLADELQKLDALRASGALTESEYAQAKARILNGQPAPQAAVSSQDRADLANPLKAFRRSSRDRLLGGVCGGLGEMTPIPSWAWRVAFCLGALSFGVGLIPYVLLWIFVPSDEYAY